MPRKIPELPYSTYDDAWALVLKHEVGPHPDGGFVNHPSDPGGATRWGVSLRWLRAEVGPIEGDVDGDGDVDVDDIRGLPKQLARQLFRDRFWRPLRCAEMMDPVGLKLFDMAVNVGITQGVKLLQDALNRSESRTKWNAYPKLLRDGIMGENTLDAVQHNHPDELTNLICEEQADFYRLLIRQNPKFEDFKDGWLNRAYSLYVGDLPEEVSIT